MEFQRIASNDQLRGILAGEIGVQEADELKSHLLNLVLDSAPRILLDLARIEKVDATFYQLLIALRNSVDARQKSLQIESLEPEHPVLKQARNLGFDTADFGRREESSV